MLLYLGSSANIARDESWLVIALLQAIRRAEDPGLSRLQLVFKPHPANLRALPGLDAAGIPVYQRERGRPDTADALAEFRDVLHHAVAWPASTRRACSTPYSAAGRASLWR